MAYSQNGWPVVLETECRQWIIPEANRHLLLRRADVGFVLVHFAYNFHKTVERLDDGNWDEWGWSPRYIQGSTRVSNHWSGTAMDLNSLAHPLGASGTFTKIKKLARLYWLLNVKYQGKITWGGGWKRPDEMHFEINGTPNEIHALARKLRRTAWGKLIRRTNGTLPPL